MDGYGLRRRVETEAGGMGWDTLYRCEDVCVWLLGLEERVPRAMFGVSWNATATNKAELIISHVVIVVLVVGKCQKPKQNVYLFLSPLSLSPAHH